MTEEIFRTDMDETFHYELKDDDSDEEMVSDKVQVLANSIYQEFANMIKLHGPGTVDGLTPLVVTMLETMDKLYTNRDELVIKLELMREDQAQLYTQYDREKTLRKFSEEKINRLEDAFDEERQATDDRMDLLESNNKLADMKLKNCRDLISRLEEKEAELRRDYTGLQQRHTDLLRVRSGDLLPVRSLMLANNHHRRSVNSQASVLTATTQQDPHDCSPLRHTPEPTVSEEAQSIIESCHMPSDASLFTIHSNIDLQKEIENKEHRSELEQPLVEDGQLLDPRLPDYGDTENDDADRYSELDYAGEDDEDNDHEELDMSNMHKEIDYLIRENQELTETKSALNVVKDDLITRLDDMTGELCILRDELKNSNMLKREYKAKMTELDKKLFEVTKENSEKTEELAKLNDENMIEFTIDCEGGQTTKTKFTRSEVSRILLERNKYKEELIELQEAVKYQNSVNKMPSSNSKRQSLFKIFSTVLSSATAFTTEALIGSGNELTVSQLHRAFSGAPSHHLSLLPTSDTGSDSSGDHGPRFPDMALPAGPTPGSVVRVSPSANLLVAQFRRPPSAASQIDIVPVSEDDDDLTIH